MSQNYVVSIWNKKNGQFSVLVHQFYILAVNESAAFQWAVNNGYKANSHLNITVNKGAQ